MNSETLNCGVVFSLFQITILWKYLKYLDGVAWRLHTKQMQYFSCEWKINRCGFDIDRKFWKNRSKLIEIHDWHTGFFPDDCCSNTYLIEPDYIKLASVKRTRDVNVYSIW